MFRNLNRFIGREQELAWVIERIRDAVPLLTLFGPPGVGKTRLAVEAAHAVAQMGTTVRFVDLSTARTEGDVAELVLAAISEAERPSGDARGAVARALSALGAALVVLDSFEHLSEIAARALVAWAAYSSAITLLVTSREVVRVPGEIARELGPLACPASAEDIERSSAGQMLLELIENYALDGPKSEADRNMLHEILNHVDGLPLAIEVVAPRIALMGVAAVHSELHTLLAASVRPPRTANKGARTLRDTLEWSWSLLEPNERTLLVHTSVFAGGFTLEALAFVAAAPNTASVASVVSSARDRSLLRALPPTPGSPRFDTYGILADFFLEKLVEVGLREAAERRHRSYFVSSAMRLERHPTEQALAVLQLEARNIEVALERSLAGGEQSESLSLIAALIIVPAPGASVHRRRALVERACSRLDVDANGVARAASIATIGAGVVSDPRVNHDGRGDAALPARDEASAAADALVVHVEGHWFRPPGGATIRCRTRRAVRLLLVALADARCDRPGLPLGVDDLRSLGWPDEKMDAESARNRIKQSMAVLRKLGLGDCLLWRDGGYMLDPAIPLVLSS